MTNESQLAEALRHYEEGLSNLCKSQANKSTIWYGQAIRDFTEAITADPNMMRAYVLRATCYTALGETEKATEDNLLVRQLESAGLSQLQTDRSVAQTFYEKARWGMENGGLISNSLYYIYKAIDADPTFADAYDARSDVYFNLGMADESIADIQRVGDLKKADHKLIKRPWWKIW